MPCKFEVNVDIQIHHSGLFRGVDWLYRVLHELIITGDVMRPGGQLVYITLYLLRTEKD